MLICNNLTIVGGTIKGGIQVQDGTLELKGVKMENPRCITVAENGVCNIDKDCALEGDGSDAVVVVWNGTLNTAGDIHCDGENYAIAGNGTQSGDINILGGKITSKDDSAIYLPNAGTCNISAGEIEGKDGIYQKSGKLVINGGKIHGNGNAEYKYSGNGSNAMGHGVVVEFTNYPAGLSKLEINGGEITADNKDAIGYYVSPKCATQDLEELVAANVVDNR